MLEFAEYRKWRRAEYPRLKALETRHYPPPTRREKRIRKASVIRVIKPILCSSYNVISLYAVYLRFIREFGCKPSLL